MSTCWKDLDVYSSNIWFNKNFVDEKKKLYGLKDALKGYPFRLFNGLAN